MNIIWGLISGLIICIENIYLPYLNDFKKKNKKREKVINLLSVLFTFIVICFTWIFFRSDTLSDAIDVYTRIFTSFIYGEGYSSFTDIYFVLRLFIVIMLFILIPYLPKIDFNCENKEFGNVIKTSLLLLSSNQAVIE